LAPSGQALHKGAARIKPLGGGKGRTPSTGPAFLLSDFP